jgi:gas vesicle structural protein
MSVAASRPSNESLAEIVDRILDKGLVIDIWARVSVVGIEILTVEARIVVASVDTFLHYAKEISKLEIASQSGELEDLENLDLGTSPMVQPAPERPQPQIEEDRANNEQQAEQ